MIKIITEQRQEIINNNKNIIFVIGETGTGKTFLFFERAKFLSQIPTKKPLLLLGKDIAEKKTFEINKKNQAFKKITVFELCKEFLSAFQEIKNVKIMDKIEQIKIIKHLFPKNKTELNIFQFEKLQSLFNNIRSRSEPNILYFQEIFKQMFKDVSSFTFDDFSLLFKKYKTFMNKDMCDEHFIINLFNKKLNIDEQKDYFLNNYSHLLIDDCERMTEIEIIAIIKIYKIFPTISVFGNKFKKKNSIIEENYIHQLETATKISEINILNKNFLIPHASTYFLNKYFNQSIDSKNTSGIINFHSPKNVSSLIQEIEKTITHKFKNNKKLTFCIACINENNLAKIKRDFNKEIYLTHQNKSEIDFIYQDYFKLTIALLYFWSLKNLKVYKPKQFEYTYYKFWSKLEEIHELTEEDFQKINEHPGHKNKFDMEIFKKLDTLGFSPQKVNSGLKFYKLINDLWQIWVDEEQSIGNLLFALWKETNLVLFYDLFKKTPIRNSLTHSIREEIKSIFPSIVNSFNRLSIFSLSTCLYEKFISEINQQKKSKNIPKITFTTLKKIENQKFDFLFICDLNLENFYNLKLSFEFLETYSNEINDELFLMLTRGKDGIYINKNCF